MTNSAERLVNRRALIGEKLRTALSDIKTIFEPNPKLAIDHDRWFVAEAHARLNWRLVSAHNVTPLVSIESDTMARAMRQSGSLVIRTKAGVGNHFARGRINCFEWRANFCGSKTCVL